MSDTARETLVPVLQLVHVSDWHLRDAGFKDSNVLGKMQRLLSGLSRGSAQAREVLSKNYSDMAIDKFCQSLRESLEDLIDGFAGHDETAIEAFSNVLVELTEKDSEWSGETTWLVDTGDLTTFGDSASLEMGIKILGALVSKAGKMEYRNIYGNHDAWPETQPILSTPQNIANRNWLRNNIFTMNYPGPPLVKKSSRTSSDIYLYTLNSVVHNRRSNAWARGNIDQDLKGRGMRIRNAQVKALKRDVIGRMADTDRRDFRIVLSHHPIHEPEHLQYTYSMRLKRQRKLGRLLNQSKKGPLAHLFLSGHTHQLYPNHRNLASRFCNLDHRYLSKGQCQLVIGSMMKRPNPLEFSRLSPVDESRLQFLRSNHDELFASDIEVPAGERKERLALERAYAKYFNQQFPHQFQVLRFYQDPNASNQMEIQRIVFVRENGLGDYQLILPTEWIVADI